MHRDDRRHALRDLAHVVDAHDDEAALDELGAAGVDDGDARTVALDRLLDALVPDGVAREVEVVEHESADGREQLGDSAATVPRRRPRDRRPSQSSASAIGRASSPSSRSASSSSG